MNTIDLNDPNWRPYSPDTTKTLGIFPNQLWHNNVENLGALVIFKPRAYEEYPVSKAGLDYVLKAHQEKRVVGGYVVLACRQDWKPRVVAMKDVAAVTTMLKGVPPRDGPYGPYWWLRTDFTLDGNAGLGPNERPF